MMLCATGECFDDAMEIIVWTIKRHGYDWTRDNVQLVHALCVAPTGIKYAHAWIEMEGMVYQLAKFSGRSGRVISRMPKADALLLFKPAEYTAYSVTEAASFGENSGPWVSPYTEHTADDISGPLGMTMCVGLTVECQPFDIGGRNEPIQQSETQRRGSETVH